MSKIVQIIPTASPWYFVSGDESSVMLIPAWGLDENGETVGLVPVSSKAGDYPKLVPHSLSIGGRYVPEYLMTNELLIRAGRL